MLYISTLGFSQRSNTAEALIIDTPIDNIDVLPQPVVTNSNVTVASSNLKVNNTAISGSTVNLATQSSTISFNCLLTTLDGSINNTFGNLYVYFKESATSSPIMVNYLQAVTFLPPTGSQTDYTSSLLNQSFLLNKSDFYNTGGLFYVEYKNNNNQTFKSQNYNVTGGSKTISNTVPTITISNLKYSEDLPVINSFVVVPSASTNRSGGRENSRSINFTVSISGITATGMQAGYGFSVMLRNPLGSNQTSLGHRSGNGNSIFNFNNIQIASSLLEENSYIEIAYTGHSSTYTKKVVNVFKASSISNVINHDHKIIPHGSNLNLINQSATLNLSPPCLYRGICEPQDVRTITNYKWQYKAEGIAIWIDIPNQTSKDLTLSNITENMIIRRIAYFSNEYFVSSNIISVCVNNLTATNSICCDQTITNLTPQPIIFSGSTVSTSNSFSYKWQYVNTESPSGVHTNWIDINNSNNPNVNFINPNNYGRGWRYIKLRRLIIQNEIVKNISNNILLTRNFVSGRIAETKEDITEVIKNEESNELILFPNPTKDNLNIQLPNENYKNLAIVNILGEIVKENAINNQKNIIIDMSNYTAGVYFLILEDNLGTKQTRKIIKE